MQPKTIQRDIAAGTASDASSGAIVDAKDACGNTPLAWASWHRRPNAILERLRYGQFGKGNPKPLRYENDHGSGWEQWEVGLWGDPHLGRT